MSLDHVCMNVGHDKLEAEIKFMEAAFGHIGFKEIMRPVPHAVGMGVHAPFYWLASGKKDGSDLKDQELSRDYDRHVAITVKNRAEVDQFHKAAMEAGAQDNGPPGLRAQYHPTYYGAFVISPTGINMEAVFHGSPDTH